MNTRGHLHQEVLFFIMTWDVILQKQWLEIHVFMSTKIVRIVRYFLGLSQMHPGTAFQSNYGLQLFTDIWWVKDFSLLLNLFHRRPCNTHVLFSNLNFHPDSTERIWLCLFQPKNFWLDSNWPMISVTRV